MPINRNEVGVHVNGTTAAFGVYLPGVTDSRDFIYFNNQSRPGDGVIAFQRRSSAAAGQPVQIALVVLNFSDQSRTLAVAAPAAGTYREMLDR